MNEQNTQTNPENKRKDSGVTAKVDRHSVMVQFDEDGKEMRNFEGTLLTTSDPSVGAKCFCCSKPFEVGHLTTLVPVGLVPGEDERERKRNKKPYSAVAVEVHHACASERPVS